MSRKVWSAFRFRGHDKSQVRFANQAIKTKGAKVKSFNERQKRKVIPSVKHQGIGGKEIIIEREMRCKDLATLCTIAVHNFLKRRPDLREYENRNTPVYYGHIQSKDGSWLGYFVAADELEENSNE